MNDFRPLNGSGTLTDTQLLWLYVMRSADKVNETKSMCDKCRVDRATGTQKPHNCPSCGKEVHNHADPLREEKIAVMIEQRRQRLEAQARKQEEERARIEAELEAELEAGEEVDHEPDKQEG
ncbi:hypothetical protein ACTID9_01050 [Brevibacillus fluminis]|uniref:hypothetical protein n=1 Tax=Brevibacillus fluminis TaxID=511487 RepID=UPI003F88C868